MSEECFEALLERRMSDFRSYAFKLTRRYADADDVLQDALLNVWKAYGALRGDPTNYIRSAVHNAYVDLVKHRKRRPAVSLEHEPWYYDNERVRAEVREHICSELARATKMLAPRRRAIFEDYANQMDYQGIAVKQGVSVGTVKSAVHHAKATLQELLCDRL